MSIRIKIEGNTDRGENDEIKKRVEKCLTIIRECKEYLEYGKGIGCSVADMVHDAIRWDPLMDKNLDPKEVAEIEKIMKQGKCNEVNLKNIVVKEIFDEVRRRAKTYIEIFESRKNYLKYGLGNGWAVAHELAQSGDWYPKMDKNLTEEEIKEILKWKSYKSGETVAHLIAQNNKTYYEGNLWSTKDLDILRLEDSHDRIVAFNLIGGMWRHTIFFIMTQHPKDPYYLPPWMKDKNGNPDMKILNLRNSKGETVAYHYAHNKYWLCDDINILKLDDGRGTTVAHELARSNPEWPTSKLANSPQFRDILMLSNSSGTTVAHNLAWYYNGSNQKEPIRGWKTDDIEILSLIDEYGKTVAYNLAEHCFRNHWTTKDPIVLSLKNKEGVTVEQILKEKGCI